VMAFEPRRGECDEPPNKGMKQTKIIGKAIGAALLASVSVGVVLGLGFILLGQVQGEAGGEVGRGATLLQFAFAALLLSWATSIPLGVVGGILAGIVLQRQRLPASVWVWVIRGIGVGSIMGRLAHRRPQCCSGEHRRAHGSLQWRSCTLRSARLVAR